jgi:hypothetical protein
MRKTARLSVADRPTLRGLTTGILRIAPSKVLQPCVILSSSFSSWLPLLTVLGYQPVLILTHDPTALPLIEAFTPQNCTVWCSSNWSSFSPDKELLTPTDLVGFADLRLGVHDFTLCETLNLQWVATTWPVRGSPKRWNGSHAQGVHSAIGGVTARKTNLSLWRPAHLPDINARAVGTRVPRDASTVLSATGFAKGTRKAPRVSRVFPLALANLGTPKAPIWHSGGLLPSQINRTTRVLLPCLGLPQGVWGIRRLSLPEILHSLDYNDQSVQKLEPFSAWLTPARFDLLAPLKSLEEMFQSFVVVNVNGGERTLACCWLESVCFWLKLCTL